MSKYPARLFPFYSILIGTLFFSLTADLCVAKEINLGQEQGRVYREAGLELQKEGELEEALIYYRKAIALDPQYAVTYNDAGIILETLGALEEAKAMYLEAIEVAPDYANSYFNLAIVYEEEGNYADAVTCWMKRATLGAPLDPWAEAARRRIGDIARVYPEAYGSASSQQYRKGPAQADTSEEIVPTELQGWETVELNYPGPQVALPREPPKAAVKEAGMISKRRLDNKTRAFNYLTHAKENFAGNQYVAALKEATVAEYLDPENLEISSFVEQVRKKLLQ